MNQAIKIMLERYRIDTVDAQIHALKEILQEIALLGLYRTTFFRNAAFYGGTALRILYNLPRFSEDMDFTLIQPVHDFSWNEYLQAIQLEIRSYGFNVDISQKPKSQASTEESAFLKANTLEALISIEQTAALQTNQVIKIKLELDTTPPKPLPTEFLPVLLPVPYQVRVPLKAHLFAGKMHALLCRKWNSRVKGRDWYDFIWYLQNRTPINLAELEARMKQSDHLPLDESLTREKLLSVYRETCTSLNVKAAKQDIAPFITNPAELQIWSHEFFLSLEPLIEIE